MPNELKPVRCGCGREAYIKNHPFHRGIPLYRICCEKCGMTTLPMLIIDNAIEVWNKAMGERTAKVDAGHKSVITGVLMDGHCKTCGRYVMDEDDYCPGYGARLEWNE